LSFWTKKSEGHQKYIAKVAIEILSTFVTSSSAEREFSVAR